MSSLTQLLFNYYKSVITSDRIYYEHVNHSNMNHRDFPLIGGNGSTNGSSNSEGEMLLLQRQIYHLTSELQRLSHENDSLKELQKTQKALMESKLNNSKKTIERLRKQNAGKVMNGTTPDNKNPEGQLKRREQHLLSPLPGRKLEGVGQSKGLRKVLTSRQQTLFDDDDDDMREGTADHIDDVNFIGSIRQTSGKNNNKGTNNGSEKLAQAVITSDGISEEDEEKKEQEKPHNKKRKLARKRIQKVNPDSEAE